MRKKMYTYGGCHQYPQCSFTLIGNLWVFTRQLHRVAKNSLPNINQASIFVWSVFMWKKKINLSIPVTIFLHFEVEAEWFLWMTFKVI